MRTTKMVLFAVMMVLTGTVFAHGPGKGKGEGSGMKRMKGAKIMKELNLTDTQKDQVKELQEANMKKMQESRKAIAAARKELMEAAESENVTEDEIKDLSEKVVDLMTVMALNKAQMKKDIKALLTDEQVEKFNEIHSKNKECMGQKGKSCSKGDKNCGKKRRQNRKKNKDKECEECSK